MRYTKLMLTSLALAAITGTIHLAAPAISQTAGLILTGNCTLPAGQYMLTNMRTGQAVYVEIDPTGKLLAQDPKALQFAVSPVNYNNPIGGLGTSGGTTSGTTGGSSLGGIGGALNALTGGGTNNQGTTGTGIGTGTNPNTNQQGSMWGGLLKQGMESIINKKQQP